MTKVSAVLVAALLSPSIAIAQQRVTSLESNALRIQPSALLSIDQNRTTVVDRIVAQWSGPLAQSGAGLSAEQLRAMLEGLRSDHLLAASLAGTLAGLRDALATAATSQAPVSGSLLHAKALGDAAADLTYTPVVPCRLVDTRNAGGQIGSDASRDFKVWVDAGDFSAQGGSATNCGIPANPVAVVVNITAVTPAGAGNFIAYPTGSPTSTSVLNYQSGENALANGAIVPACVPNCPNQLTIAINGAGADVVIDIAGYFKPPSGSLGTVTNIATGTGLTGGPIMTAGTIAIANSGVGTTQLSDASVTKPKLSAGGGSNGQVLGTDGTNLLWQTPATTSGGTVTSITAGAGLTGGTITTSGTIGIDPTAPTLTGSFFKQGANAFGTTAMLGTLDAEPLELYVAGGRVMRYEYTQSSPNVVGGFAGNEANGTISGQPGAPGGGRTIAGGGYPDPICNNVAGIPQGGICANKTMSDFASVGGGFGNYALGYGTTVAGGVNNWAGLTFPLNQQDYSTVSGGYENGAFGAYATVSGGALNGAGGAYAMVPGGIQNSATGTASFAAGYQANARADGEFVWADDINAVFDPAAAAHGWGSIAGATNTFNARATGGVWFVTGLDGSNQPSTYVFVNHGSGTWSGISDRSVKENFRGIDGRDVLAKVSAMPIETWNYIAEGTNVRHLGPVSQDFWSAFQLGPNDKTITQIDEGGVALAAIQGLHRLVQEKDARIAALEKSVADLKRVVETLGTKQ